MTVNKAQVFKDDDNDHTHPGKADFIAKEVKPTNAVLGVFVVVVLDEAKAGRLVSAVRYTRWCG